MESPVFVVAAANLIVFAAFFIRSLTGFGSALVSIPFLALFFDLKFAVPLEAVLEVGLSIMLMNRVYRLIRKKVLIPLIIGTLFGSLLGTYLLHSFANDFLKMGLGIAVILFALNMLLGKTDRSEKPISAWWGLPAGGIGGVFGGLFGTSGPAFVMYLACRLRTKEAFRASLIGLFAVDYLWRIGVYAATGLLTLETVKIALMLTPALILATVLGHKIHFKISEIRFKQTVSAILLASGIFLLVS